MFKLKLRVKRPKRRRPAVVEDNPRREPAELRAAKIGAHDRVVLAIGVALQRAR